MKHSGIGLAREKFEIASRPNRNEDERRGWVSDRSARVKKGTPGREGQGEDWASKTMDNGVFYNSLPPGSDGSDQEMADIRVQESSGPMGCGSQATNDLTRESLQQGFSRKEMAPTDDMSTNEHIDEFYADAIVDGVTGFCERGNVLDRN
jgi:hypothetical protein